jgi:hypothetical protein
LTETRKFDAEDQRLLKPNKICGDAYQVRLSIAAQAKANQDLQAKIAESQRAEEAGGRPPQERVSDDAGPGASQSPRAIRAGIATPLGRRE